MSTIFSKLKTSIPLMLMLSFTSMQSCDILKEDLEFEEGDNLVQMPDSLKIGLPLLNGSLSFENLVDIPENLKTDENGFYYFSESSSQEVADINTVVEAMGFSSPQALFHVDDFSFNFEKELVEAFGGTYIPGITPEVYTDANVQVIFTVERDQDTQYDEDNNLVKAYVPFTAPVTREGYDMSISYIRFTEGNIKMTLSKETPDVVITGYFENLQGNTVAAQVTSSSDESVELTFPMTGAEMDLWENGAVATALPTIQLTATGNYSPKTLVLTDNNQADRMTLVFNDDANVPAVSLSEQEHPVNFDNELFESGKVELNGENPLLLMGFDFSNSIGTNVKITPELEAYFDDGSTQTIQLTDVNGGDAIDSFILEGASSFEDVTTSSYYVYNPASLFNLSTDKKLTKLIYGGSAKVISSGLDYIQKGDEMRFSMDNFTNADITVNIPLDIKAQDIAFNLEGDGINVDFDIEDQSKGVLKIQAINSLPLDMKMLFQVTTEENKTVLLPINNGLAFVKAAETDNNGNVTAPTTFTSETTVTTEQLRAIAKSKEIKITVLVNSPDTDGDGTPDKFSKLNKESDINLKAGILATITNGNSGE
ncbi:hypothetical protein V6R21_23130 [Limibacter armeniacum]|uniref:hypothetical protein n=1 Tax=Limibacter armeniacum TaxID=466084 RepID=UPI002FE579BD